MAVHWCVGTSLPSSKDTEWTDWISAVLHYTFGIDILLIYLKKKKRKKLNIYIDYPRNLSNANKPGIYLPLT